MHAFAIPRQVADLARRVEDRGFDGLLVADSQNLDADVWVELGLAAAATERIGSGPESPTRSPATRL